MHERMDRLALVSVGEAARIGRVTVRTLHHYDSIGLLRPSKRSRGEYRLYTRADLERLHQIRLYRELELPLERIRALLDDPDLDRRAALVAHRDRLRDKARSAQALVHTLDRLIQGDEKLTNEELFDGFPTEEQAAEAEQRWGHTQSYRIAQARTKAYGKADLQRLQAEHDLILQELAAYQASACAADSKEAMDCAERLRLHMDTAYYPLSREAHLGLGRMYLTDPRFKRVYEDVAEGLTEYLVQAIEANLGRASS